MGSVSGYRATAALAASLDAAGLGRAVADDRVDGWAMRRMHRETSFNIVPAEDGGILWSMVVDGRPHLAFEEKILYRDPEESDEDDAVTREVPVDPMSLAPRIAEALRFLDLEPVNVAYVDAGYGPMVNYSAPKDRASASLGIRGGRLVPLLF